MNSNNSVPVKLGYYVLFFILITIKISIVVLLYGYINKKKIGTAFDTHLENTLTTENVLFSKTPKVGNIIHPSFIDIYKKNISNENNLLNHGIYEKYIVSIDKIEIFGLKFLGIALFIMLVSLKNQEYIEDFTNETVVKLGNLNVLIIAIIIVILFAIIASLYLFIKFMKMMKILSINEEDDDDLLLLKQGLLYQRLDAMINYSSILNTIDPNSNSNKTYWEKLITLVADNDINIDGLTNKDLTKFYEDNKDINFLAPFNGGDNIYSEIYKNTAYMGTIISGASMLVSIISLIVIFKRAE